MTVRSLIPSRRAICLLASPCRTSSITSAPAGSGPDRRGRPCGPGAQQLRAARGWIGDSPRLTARMPGQHLLRIGVLEQVAQGSRVQGGDDPLASRRRTSAPGRRRAARPTIGPGRLDPVDAGHLQVHQHDVGPRSPAPPRPPRRRRRPCRPPRCPGRRRAAAPGPARTTAWSSTTTTRIGSRSSRSHVQSHRRALPRAVSHVERGRPRRRPGWPGRAARSARRAAGSARSKPRPSSATSRRDAAAAPRDAHVQPARAARGGWRCAPPPARPARPVRRSRRARRRRPSTETSSRAPGRRPVPSGPRARRRARRRRARAGGSRPAASAAAAATRAASGRASRGCGPAPRAWRRSAAVSECSANAVPARSWTTPSWRSRAIRRRSAADASTARTSSRSRSRAARSGGWSARDHRRRRAARGPAGAQRDPPERARTPRFALVEVGVVVVDLEEQRLALRATRSGCRPRPARRVLARSGSPPRTGRRPPRRRHRCRGPPARSSPSAYVLPISWVASR